MRNLIIPPERCFSPLDDEMIDQLLTVDVLCPRRYGIKRHVPFHQQNWQQHEPSLRLLTQNGQFCHGSMIVFTPDGRGRIVNDTKCIEQVKQIIGTTPGFDFVYDRSLRIGRRRQ